MDGAQLLEKLWPTFSIRESTFQLDHVLQRTLSGGKALLLLLAHYSPSVTS